MLAIVPARSGSKGLPRKNIKDFLGKPLLAYTIEEGLKSRYIDEVIISTDDPKIAEIATTFGATNYFMRPRELATDSSLAVDTYLYTIDRLIQEYGYKIESFAVLLPVCPLRLVEDIDGAIRLFLEKNADSVVTYTKERHPISWHKYIDSDHRLINMSDERLKNRQDYRPTYHPNGAVFVFKYAIIQRKEYYTENSYAYIMPRSRSIDIDDIEDFEYAEWLFKKRLKRK